MYGKKRDNGYYWVKISEAWAWRTAFYADGLWRTHGYNVMYDQALFEINEQRIPSPDESEKLNK